MDILVGYDIRPRMDRLLCLYWEHLLIVAQVGHYYSAPFRGLRGFTQGYPLSPTIFNMVVVSVMRHWVILVAGEEAGLDGFGRAIQWISAFFYAGDRLLTSPQQDRL